MAKVTKSFSAFITKADEALGIVEAYTSVMGNVDFGDDIIVNGAYAKTIADRGVTGKIRVLDNHNSRSTEDAIARIIDIREVSRKELPAELLLKYPDATGALKCTWQHDLEDPKSLAVFRRIMKKFIDEYSIGFEIVRAEYKDVMTTGGPRTVRFILEIKLYEVSPVIFAMNDATMTAGVKNDGGKDDERPDLPDIAEPGMPKPPMPGYRKADGNSACSSCKFFGKVTEDLGYCKQHSMAAGSVMLCDDYGSLEKRRIRDDIKDLFSMFLSERLNSYFEMGLWGETEKGRFETLTDILADSLIASMPVDLIEVEMPDNPNSAYQLPKSKEQPEAEPQDGATQKALTSNDERIQRAALLATEIEARMNKQKERRQ